MIDLVGDVPEPEPAAAGSDIGNGLRRHHHAGRVGRAHGQHAGERLLAMGALDQVGRQRETGFGADLDRHWLQSERDQDVAIGRIARRRDRDPRTRLETGEEGEDEAARRARGHDHALGRHLDAISILIMAGDAIPQRIRAERLRISDPAVLQRAGCGCADRGRRRRRGLADLHMHDRAAAAFDGRRLVHHVHDDEGRDALGSLGQSGQGGGRNQGLLHRLVRFREEACPRSRACNGLQPSAASGGRAVI